MDLLRSSPPGAPVPSIRRLYQTPGEVLAKNIHEMHNQQILRISTEPKFIEIAEESSHKV
jgi:hypothetical protein